LTELARRKGLAEKIVFTGFRREVAPLISMFDLAVLPSFFEGMGRVLLEAMAMGIPVIGSNVGGIPDLVRHGSEGLLVPPGDPSVLASAIRSLIHQPRRAKQMGRAGVRRVTETFSAQKMVREIEQVYLNALTEKGFSHSRADR
jgi:glycosyltransferase involved in cell wall biosynthesis